MSNAWACLYVSTTQWHCDCPPSPTSLPDSLLVWPTEGNSYSLVIMGGWCVHWSVLYLPDYHLEGPLGPRRTKMERGQGWDEDRGMMGEQCEARTMDHGRNYKGEIWPDKQYCVLQMSIGRGISAAVIWSGGDGGGEGGRQMERCGRLRYEIVCSGGFTRDVPSHGIKKSVNIQNWWGRRCFCRLSWWVSLWAKGWFRASVSYRRERV